MLEETEGVRARDPQVCGARAVVPDYRGRHFKGVCDAVCQRTAARLPLLRMSMPEPSDWTEERGPMKARRGTTFYRDGSHAVRGQDAVASVSSGVTDRAGAVSGRLRPVRTSMQSAPTPLLHGHRNPPGKGSLDEVTPISYQDPEISVPFQRVIRRAMAKNPEERFPRADQLLHALDDVDGGRYGHSEPETGASGHDSPAGFALGGGSCRSLLWHPVAAEGERFHVSVVYRRLGTMPWRAET